MNTNNVKVVSIIVPCYNEEEVILEFKRVLLSVLDILDYKFEIIFVNDGSSDSTLDLLLPMTLERGDVSVLTLSRNFGHQAAITCGLAHSRGDAAIIIDADLQDPPTVIPEMIRKWESGAQIVYARRSSRLGETRLKILTAKFFYRIQNRLAEIEAPVDTGDFRLVDREVVNAFLKLPERQRYVRGMFAWLGFESASVYYERDVRFAGTTKYTLKKMLRLASYGVLSFSTRPLRLVMWLGVCVSVISMLLGISALASKFFFHGYSLPGYTSLVVLITFLGGMQLLAMGIIGEYLGLVYTEGKARPLYFLNEKRSKY